MESKPQESHRRRWRLAAIALGVAAVVMLLLAALGLFDSQQSPREGRQADTPAPRPIDDAHGADTATRASATSAALDVAVAPSRECELAATLVDRWGLPVYRAKVLLGPAGTLCRVEGDEHRGDQVHVAWRGSAGTLWITSTRSGGLSGLRMLEVKPGSPARLVLGVDEPESAWSMLAALAPGQPRLATEARFAVPLRPFAEPLFGGTCIGGFDLRGPKPTGTIEGIVHDSNGAPARDITVAVLRVTNASTYVGPRTTTDVRGHFVIRELPEGEWQVRAGGGGEGLAVAPVRLPRGGALVCELQLALGPHVRGRIVDDTGHRVDGWRIVYEGEDEPSFALVASHGDGAFIVPIDHGSRGRLLFWSPDAGCLLPLRSMTVGAADGEILVAAVVPDPAAGFTLRLPVWATAEGTMRAPSADAFVFREDSRRGALMNMDDSGAVFTIHGVAAGWYRVVVATLTHGSVDLGRHWSDGRLMVDLGTLDLPELATVRFALGWSGKVDTELCQVHGDDLLRIDGLDLTAAEGVRLPPGKYDLHWREADGPTQQRSFAVAAGEHAVVARER